MINISTRMQSPFIFLISFITLLSTVFHHLKCQAETRDSIIRGGNQLIDGTNETLVSVGKRFELGFFTPDGNEKGSRYIGIWYYDRDPRTIVWVACRDTPLTDASGVFGIADDGNVKLWNRDKLFGSVTNVADSRNTNRTLKLLDSGNLILVDGGSSEVNLWQSFDHPTDTFLPGMQMGAKILSSWISPSDPASGNYTFLRDQDQGVYIMQKGSTAYWRSRNGGSLQIYNHVPNYVDQMLGGLDQTNGELLADRPNYIFYNFSSKHAVYNNVTRVLMNTSGLIQYFEGDAKRGWWLRWSEPNDSCQVYEPCGKSANCDSRNQLICQCLPGFKPQYKEDWDLGRYSEGCVKEESISCQDDGDKMKRFLNLPVKKVESNNAQRFDLAGKNTTCERECLSDCKCTAYLRSGNSTSRETADIHLYCWLWMQDLTNLRIGRNHEDNWISIRAPDTESMRNCQPCFLNQIPYPLSSGSDCGDPLYRSFSCDNSTGLISFLTISGQYPVIGIHEATNSFVIQYNSKGDVRCKTGNISIQNLKLDQSLPFVVTNPCYIEPGNANPDVQVGNQIEISWRIPMEPTCNYSGDCKDWPDSYCYDKGDGQKRCYCNRGYEWGGSSVSCTNASTNDERQEEGSENKKRMSMKYVIFSIISVAGVVLTLSCIKIARRTRLFEGEGNIDEEPVIFSHEYEGPVDDLMNIEKDGTKAIGVPFYSLDIVLSATDKFSDANKLGQGGFGPVYKGKFPGGQEIAVKRLSSCSRQGIKEFQNEVVLISKLQHRNLVRLLGYSISKHEKILLYEYMPNRSLDAFIFDQENRLLLNWNKRFDIILGIARGLLYLHQDSRLRVIHRDLKTGNILLDENMNPKISDFGLARIVEGKGAETSTKNVIGTLGYMSPEYALEGKFSTKSDVFSFGVMLLEIVSGKKNTGYHNQEQVLNLLRYAWILWTEKKAQDLTDPTLVESCDESQVIKCINIGLLCVQEDPGDRPTMSNVVVMLDSETSPLPPPTQPAFVVRRRLSVASSSSSKPDTISNNELTISMDQGR